MEKKEKLKLKKNEAIKNDSLTAMNRNTNRSPICLIDGSFLK